MKRVLLVLARKRDRLAAKADLVRGGLIVLGSIHTEMVALLEDRTAPLYNRVTDTINLTHLDIGSILSILQDHAEPTPERLLFLWNLFEGVPKFYRDCYEQDVLAAERRTLLRRIFFESSSPLRTEAENWFLRELRGRYDVVLKFVARNPGRMHKEFGAGDSRGQRNCRYTSRRVLEGTHRTVRADRTQVAGIRQTISKAQPLLRHRQFPPLVAGGVGQSRFSDRVSTTRRVDCRS